MHVMFCGQYLSRMQAIIARLLCRNTWRWVSGRISKMWPQRGETVRPGTCLVLGNMVATPCQLYLVRALAGGQLTNVQARASNHTSVNKNLEHIIAVDSTSHDLLPTHMFNGVYAILQLQTNIACNKVNRGQRHYQKHCISV